VLRDGIVAGSFRDPAGVVFRHEGIVYRQVHETAIEALNLLEVSGLFDELCDRRMLVRHEQADVAPPDPSMSRRVIRPEQIPFVSYPYEWSFGQLKDAALLTLEAQMIALRHGMSLKDASAFNVQFLDGLPILIDTLSFERYKKGAPWVAYRQFCEHFLAPLLIIQSVDPWLSRLSSITADGIPLETASRILPRRSWLRPSALLHVHLHARSIRHFGSRRIPEQIQSRGMTRTSLENLIDGLRHSIAGLDWTPTSTQWADYEVKHGYSAAAMNAKREWVQRVLTAIGPKRVWDLGANTGEFSRLAAASGAAVIAIDVDHAAVELNYRRIRSEGLERVHPLWIDLCCPSPQLGWAEAERDGLTNRADADCVLALALIHHLAIAANVPLPNIASWLSKLAPHLIIEFVPKEDPQVSRLLVSREDVFFGYGRREFEMALEQWFTIQNCGSIPGTERVLYHAIRRNSPA
jgi:SAM-dependent methyltransferase